MKQPLQPKHLPLLALGAGMLGLGLGIWLFASGMDGKMLLLRSHPANAATVILTAVVMLVLYLCVRQCNGTLPYKKLFRPSLWAMVGCFVAAAGILSTNIYELSYLEDPVSIVSCLSGLFAAGALIFVGICRKTGRHPHPIFHSCITVYFILHLVSQYRNWSSEPQLQVYAFQLLASIFLMLSLYHRTTLDAGFGNRKSYLFFINGALYFCFLALCSGNRVFYGTMAIYAATASCSAEAAELPRTMYLPREVLFCLNALKAAGHSAYAVGGCVRDALLGLTPQDYDICTSASPEQICIVFAQYSLVRNGEKHGTVGVVIDGEVYEITTFRTEGGYSDARHPDWVEFVSRIEDDLARRDFTVNAIAYAPDTGFVDPWGGQADLEAKVLRAVGDPILRFSEDSLRILRGVRFSVRYGLKPEENTENAMISQAPLLDKLAKERIFSELCKLLPYANAQALIRFAPILTQIIPELSPAVGFQQHSPHHAYDVFTHTAYVVQSVPADPALRFAALLHDIGKPGVFTQDENGRGHFYGHARESAKMANEILLRLKAPNAFRSQVVFLVEHHMTPFESDKKLLRRRIAKFGNETTDQLITLQKADYISKGVDEGDEHYFAQIEELIAEIRQEGSSLSVKDLALNGADLLSLGVEPGPHIGECMNFLLDLVHDELVTNNKNALMDAAKDFFAMR